jgi:hypothetical protein
MGHRANYAIREGARVELYRSHWGALDVPRDLFWGSESAVEFVRELSPVGGWMDEVFCEGGAAIDLDQRALTLYGGEALLYEADLRPLYLELLALSWEGWRVAWAYEGVTDLLRALSIDDEPYRSKLEKRTVSAEQVREFQTAGGWAQSVFTVIEQDGRCSDFGSQMFAEDLLPMGPKLIELLMSGPRYEISDEVRGSQGALIDVRARQIATFPQSFHRVPREQLQAVWPGWSIEVHTEGLAGQWRRSGRDPGVLQRSDDEVLKCLSEILLPKIEHDFLGMMQRLTADLSAEGKQVQVNPEAMRVFPSNVGPEQRASRFESLVQRWRRKREAGTA